MENYGRDIVAGMSKDEHISVQVLKRTSWVLQIFPFRGIGMVV